MADVEACFRLLLRRAPTPAEIETWQALVNVHQITLQATLDQFLYTAEFQERQAAARRPELVELEDFKLYVRPNDFFVGQTIARTRQYELAVSNTVRSHLRSGDVFLDIGANIGYFTLMAATLVGRNGAVHAVEPNPDNCHLLAMSVEANAVDNVTVYPFAAAERDQTFQLDTVGDGSNGRIIDDSREAVPGTAPPQPVQAVALDHLLESVERIDLIKIDIEGAEPRALAGMTNLVQQHRPHLITEFSPGLIEVTSHVPPEHYLRQLQALGYSLFVIGQEGVPNRPLAVEQIMASYSRANTSHLDLFGVPVEK